MSNDERRWCQVAITYGGDFVRTFAEACMRADEDNEHILRSALWALIAKYPDYIHWPEVTPQHQEQK